MCMRLKNITALPREGGRYCATATMWWDQGGRKKSRRVILRGDMPITPRNATAWLRDTLAEGSLSL